MPTKKRSDEKRAHADCGARTHPATRTITFALFILICASQAARAQDVPAQWLNGSGNWSDPTQWSTNPIFPNNGAQTYSVTASAGSITLDQNITVDQFTLSYNPPVTNPPPNVTLEGSNTLTVNSSFVWDNAIVTGSGTINSLGTTNISGTSNTFSGWTLNLAGATSLNGQVATSSNATINNELGATLNMADGSSISGTSTFTNSGTVNVAAPTNGATISASTLTNTGTINVNTGTLNLGSAITSSGSVTVANGSTLAFSSYPSGTFTNTSSITGAGSALFETGTLAVNGNYNLGGTTAFSGTAAVTFGASSSFTGSTVTFQGGTVTFGGSTNITQATTTFGGYAAVNFTGTIQSLGNSAIVNGQFANVNIGSPVVFNTLQMVQGTVTGAGNITVTNSFQWGDPAMTGSGTTTAQSGILFTEAQETNGFGTLNRTLNLYGSSSALVYEAYQGTLFFDANAAINIEPGASFNGSRFAIQGSDEVGITLGTLTNQGSLLINNSGLNDGMSVSGTNFVNTGSITVNNSSLGVLSTGSQPVFNQNSGSMVLVNGKLTGSTFNINGGSFSGYGSIEASIYNNGLMTPSGGNLVSSQSALTLGPASVLSFSLGGTGAGVGYDQITNLSSATLGGDLELAFSSGFQSQINSSETFTLISTSSALTGEFLNVPNGGTLETTDGYGSFEVTYSGDNVVLSNFVPTPEPDSAMLFFGGSLLLGFFRIRFRTVG